MRTVLTDKDGQPKTKVEAFAAKTVTLNGERKDLFKRIHGVKTECLVGIETVIDFIVPYANAKIEALQIINGEVGDHVDLQVLDTDTGTISTVPNYMLNQFGFSVFMDKSGYYEQKSQYDADVISGMVLRVKYFNEGATKDIYLNFVLNEVK